MLTHRHGNTTVAGYPSWEGERLTGEQLSRLMEVRVPCAVCDCVCPDTHHVNSQGMERNGLAGHTHILTGYAGRADLLHALARVVQTTTRHRPDAVYRNPVPHPLGFRFSLHSFTHFSFLSFAACAVLCVRCVRCVRCCVCGACGACATKCAIR
jgi:hypothetical protein